MPPRDRSQPTIAQLLHDLMRDVTEPVPVKEVIDQILQRRASKAKDPRASVRLAINQEVGRTVVFTDKDHILPIDVAMRGVRFRIPLSQSEINEGGFWSEYLHYYLPIAFWQTREEKVTFLDEAGQPISARWTAYTETLSDPLLGEYTHVTQLLSIKPWLRAKDARPGDYLIFTIEDYDDRIVRLDFERASQARVDEIERKDKQLCDILFDMLEHSGREQLYPPQDIPSALARLPDKVGYPGHHWRIAIQTDGRMRFDGFVIEYPDASPSLFERLVEGYEFEGKPFTREQGSQVYRISARLKRASRKHRPVVVEIQGNQTLYDLDQILRIAFGHDIWDHLGGFWLLVPRANNRFREVEIGACAPDPNFELEGSAVDVAVAGVGLQVGTRLKYVYNFGDWIEHELVVEAIEPPQPRVHYPRIVER